MPELRIMYYYSITSPSLHISMGYIKSLCFHHLLIVSLHTQEDGICCEAGQTTFDIRLASQLLSFCIQVVERSDRLLKLLFINLKQIKEEQRVTIIQVPSPLLGHSTYGKHCFLSTRSCSPCISISR